MNDSSPKSVFEVDRILVVDDIADNYFMLQVFLEGEGYQVEVAESGRAALAQIEASPPDLVLLDVMMPQMDGFEVTRQIRQNERLPFVPILLVTGYREPTAAEAFDVGADGFIRKPVDLNDLLERVRAILQPRHAIDRAI